MSDVEDVLVAELRLPMEARAAVAAELIASLDGVDETGEDVEAAWSEEIQQHLADVDAGIVTPIPGRKPGAESSQPPAVVVKPLEIHPAAAWYAERDPRVAARFTEELEATLNRIAEAPHRRRTSTAPIAFA